VSTVALKQLAEALSASSDQTPSPVMVTAGLLSLA
jgi:hypothetical protein